MQNAEIIAAIDELNQYLNGNVTKTSLQITLSDLINKLQQNKLHSQSVGVVGEHDKQQLNNTITFTM